MKIAFFTYLTFGYGGGLEKYFVEIPSELKKHCPGLNISIISLDEKMTEKLRFLLSFYYFKKIHRSNLYREKISTIIDKLGEVKYIKCKSFKEAKKELLSYDVIYSKNEILEALTLKFLIGYKNLPPVIFGVHTPHFYPMAKSFHAKLHNFLYSSSFYNFLTNGVKCFHVLNQESVNVFKKQFPTKKIVKIYHPFDGDKFKIKANKYKYNFQFNKAKFNILWVGRLTEQKGINDLAQIIESINNSEYKDKIAWNIVGDGNEKEKEKILALKKKWDNLTYFGYVENDYIASLLKENNLFISTSKWEGNPFNIVEAQAMNLPVIAYNIPGPSDLIVNNKNGLLVGSINDFTDEIKNFIDHKYNFQNISRNLKKKFESETVLNSLINLFKNV